jgi:type IX secretion system substrate protein
MKKIYFFNLILTLIAVNVFSQTSGVINYAVSIPTTTITTLNLRKTSAFVIDNNNNKWIGFNYGNIHSFQLLRFNGTQWDTFPAFNAISPLNKVNALAVDASNNLWIGSNMGLTKYDGTSFTTYNTTNSTISSDTIISLACGSGNVYAGNYKGLSVYNGTGFTNYNRVTNGLTSDTVNCITVESATVIWIGNKYGMDKFNGSNFTFNYVVSGNVKDTVYCIYIDATNNKWIGTYAHGVVKYDNTNFYTMQQLYPNPNTEQDFISVGYWPITIKTICKGFHGGAFFGGGEVLATALNGCRSAYFDGSFEVTPSQIYQYPELYNESYGILQHDLDSNVVFYINYGGGYPYPISSFDPALYSTPPFYSMTNTNSAFLDINNVNALITDNSNQHWDANSGITKYFVPKQNNTSPLFTSAMWIGGYANNNLHMAAMTYRQNGNDFWPGPLNPSNDSITTGMMNAYNQVWKVNRFDIANFLYAWSIGTVQSGVFVPPASILNWPGNSPYGTGQLAPYVDINHNGIYDPIAGGDYPLIKGDQMIWSVYNDQMHHGETGCPYPLGIEVHASAYAFTCPTIADSDVVLNNTTFYNYQIFNRSTNQYDSTRLTLWIDSDLGDYQDDYVGCDVMNNFGYTYNGDNFDADMCMLSGYHSNLPVFACNVLNGPLANPHDGIDNNNNGVIDEANEHCLMDGFTYYNNDGSPINGNPSGTEAGVPYYNLASEVWENGTPMTYGQSGLTTGGTPCRYLYPGNSDPYGIGLGGSIASPVVPIGSYAPTGWTEGQAGNQFGDRRFMVNIGPFTMLPDSSYNFDYALVFTQDSADCYGNAVCPITRAVQDNQRIRNWFNNNTFPSCLSLVGLGIQQNNATQSLNINLYPNPANSIVYIAFDNPQNKVTIEVYDMLGKIITGLKYNDLVQYVSIPVSELQSGVYMVKILTQEGSAVKKFVKE